MNIIVKESFLLGILNANNQMKKAFTTKFSRFLLLLLGGDTEICPGPQKTLSDFFTSRGFKIVHQNVRGIPSNHRLLESFVNKTELKTDMICVSETHIKDGIFVCDNSSLYSLPDYKSSKSVLIGCYYRPPEWSKHLMNNFNEVFEEQLTNVVETNKEIIILGDFNIDYNKTDNRGFKSLLNIFGLKQVITEPIRTTETSSI